MHFVKIHIDAHIKMSMCMYAGIHSSKLDYPLPMSRAATVCPGIKLELATPPALIMMYTTQHYNTTLWLLL